MNLLFTFILQATPPVVNWPEIAATLINTVVVMILVQFLKNKGIPWLKEKTPWLMPILPTFVGVGLSYLTNYLVNLLGYPIDFGPIMGLFTGVLAVTTYEIGDRFKK